MDSNTAKFDLSGDRTADVHALMSYVLSALKEKGYNPINQLVGYFISGDPTYITSEEKSKYNGICGGLGRLCFVRSIFGSYTEDSGIWAKHPEE